MLASRHMLCRTGEASWDARKVTQLTGRRGENRDKARHMINCPSAPHVAKRLASWTLGLLSWMGYDGMVTVMIAMI